MLECIAYLTMIIDHIGLVFFPNNLDMRIVGRLAFPIFLYMAALGLNRTSDKGKYLKRIFLIAVLSQFPYAKIHWYQRLPDLNICYTLLLILAIMINLKAGQYTYAVLGVLAGWLTGVEYGICGVLCGVVVMHDGFRAWERIALITILLVAMCIQMGNPIELAAIPVFVLLEVFRGDLIKDRFTLPRLLKYAIYPAHLIIISIIRELIIALA